MQWKGRKSGIVEERDLDSMLIGVCPDTHLDVEGDADRGAGLQHVEEDVEDTVGPEDTGVSGLI